MKKHPNIVHNQMQFHKLFKRCKDNFSMCALQSCSCMSVSHLCHMRTLTLHARRTWLRYFNIVMDVSGAPSTALSHLVLHCQAAIFKFRKPSWIFLCCLCRCLRRRRRSQSRSRAGRYAVLHKSQQWGHVNSYSQCTIFVHILYTSSYISLT